MHAFLIVVDSPSDTSAAISEIVRSNGIKKTIEFPFARIDDARTLNKFANLSLSESTAIILNRIEEATTEAMNAFLKNLEEPQEKLYYILTTANLHAILPTIASRCQIIKVRSEKFKVKSQEAEKFLKSPLGEKLAFVDTIRERQRALSFVDDLVRILHHKLHKSPENSLNTAKNIEKAMLAYNNLKANGNVALQLANMAISLV